MARQSVEQRLAALEQQVRQLTRIAQSQQATINALSGYSGRVGAIRTNATNRPSMRRAGSPSASDFDRDPAQATFDTALARQRALMSEG